MNIYDWVVEFGFSISLLVNALLFIPQVITILKRKTVEGLSLITFFGFNVIQLFTMLHGILTEDYLLASGYFLSLLSCGTVTMLIIYFRWFSIK